MVRKWLELIADRFKMAFFLKHVVASSYILVPHMCGLYDDQAALAADLGLMRAASVGMPAT